MQNFRGQTINNRAHHSNPKKIKTQTQVSLSYSGESSTKNLYEYRHKPEIILEIPEKQSHRFIFAGFCI